MIIKRESRTGANDLQTIYRPCKVDEIVGQETNKKLIRGGLETGKLPHSHLFTGPPGCGKTTAARIIALALNCFCVEGNGGPLSYEEYKNLSVDEKKHVIAYGPLPPETDDVPDSKKSYKIMGYRVGTDPCLRCASCSSILNHNSMDTLEINVGAYGNKGDILKVIEDLPTAPFMSRYKVMIFDEAHKLTPAAQDALLKIIEDGYDHVYFIFCTDEPEKLDPAFYERCTKMHFGRISISLVRDLLENVSQFEGMEYNAEVINYLAEESQGVPRRALVWLKAINDSNSWTLDEAKEVTGVMLDENSAEVIELCRALNKGEWKDSVRLYGSIKKVPPETVRLALEGYFTSCLKRAGTYGKGRLFSAILDEIGKPIYQTGKTANNRMYHYMFKIVETIQRFEKGGI